MLGYFVVNKIQVKLVSHLKYKNNVFKLLFNESNAFHIPRSPLGRLFVFMVQKCKGKYYVVKKKAKDLRCTKKEPYK